MTTTAQLLEQRSTGEVRLRVEQRGIAVLQDSGSLKVRIPRGSNEAILLNVGGGVAGGDVLKLEAEVGSGARLSMTTQTAERIYRTLGPPARVCISLTARPGSSLFWLPQETILFEASALHRTLAVDLASDATFLAVEPLVFGRKEMGETVKHASLSDRWEIRMENRLVHVEAMALGSAWQSSSAQLAGNLACATLLLISPRAGELLQPLRTAVGRHGGASAWNGKLVARIACSDGYALRKVLIQAINACTGPQGVPKCWTF